MAAGENGIADVAASIAACLSQAPCELLTEAAELQGLVGAIAMRPAAVEALSWRTLHETEQLAVCLPAVPRVTTPATATIDL